MPWSRSKQTAAKYRTPEHRRERERLLRELRRVGQAVCAQPECVMKSRIIVPGDPVALGHDESGENYIGLVHKRCNDRDGAKRGNARRREREERPRRRSREW